MSNLESDPNPTTASEIPEPAAPKSTPRHSVKSDFSLQGILLIPIAVALNLVGAQLVDALKLPIYLDSIGTVLAGILAGPWVGATTGVLSNGVNAIFSPTYLPYALVSLGLGLASGFLSRAGFFAKPWKVLASGIVLTLVATLIGTPITTYLFGGVTGVGTFSGVSSGP
jgi:energy-coupling factor transport system substrate-specific component